MPLAFAESHANETASCPRVDTFFGTRGANRAIEGDSGPNENKTNYAGFLTSFGRAAPINPQTKSGPTQGEMETNQDTLSHLQVRLLD